MRHDPANPGLTEKEFEEELIELTNNVHLGKEQALERAFADAIVLAANPGIPFDTWVHMPHAIFPYLFDKRRVLVPTFAESWAGNPSVPLFELMGQTSSRAMGQALMEFQFYMPAFAGLHDLEGRLDLKNPKARRPGRRVLQRKALGYLDHLLPHMEPVAKEMRYEAKRALGDPTYQGRWIQLDNVMSPFLRRHATPAQIALWMRVQQRWWELFVPKPVDLFTFDGAPSFRQLIETLSPPVALP